MGWLRSTELENAKDEIVRLTSEKGEAREKMDRLQDEKEKLSACLAREREDAKAHETARASHLEKVKAESKCLQAQREISFGLRRMILFGGSRQQKQSVRIEWKVWSKSW